MSQGGVKNENSICSGEENQLHLIFFQKQNSRLLFPDSQLDTVIEAITEIARTGQGEHGDGIIFVSTVDQAIKIATSEKGEKVIL